MGMPAAAGMPLMAPGWMQPAAMAAAGLPLQPGLQALQGQAMMGQGPGGEAYLLSLQCSRKCSAPDTPLPHDTAVTRRHTTQKEHCLQVASRWELAWAGCPCHGMPHLRCSSQRSNTLTCCKVNGQHGIVLHQRAAGCTQAPIRLCVLCLPNHSSVRPCCCNKPLPWPRTERHAGWCLPAGQRARPMRQPRPARAQHHGGHHPHSSSDTQSLSRTVSTAASTGAPLDSDELPAVKSSLGARGELAGRASIPGVDLPKGTGGPSASGPNLEEKGRPQSSQLETRSSSGNGDGSPAQGAQEAPARIQVKGRQQQQAASHEVPAGSVQAGQKLQGAPGQLEQLTQQLAGMAPGEDAKDS